jgi:ribose transport system substrate-binding protein
MKSSNGSAKHVLVAAVAVLLASVLVACGSGKSSGSEETANSTSVAKYQQELNVLYKGDFKPPSGPPVKPVKGKNIWAITLSMATEPSQNTVAALEDAADMLGWNLSVFDGKFESSRALTGIQQALAAKADGIILFSVDCPAVKAGVQQAVEAGVPVIGVESRDCEPTLANYNLTFLHDQGFQKWIEDGFAGSQAKWVVAKTKGEAKTIVTVETDVFVTRIALPGIERVFDKCPTCEIVDVVNFVGADFGPPLQQKIEQSLNQHPEANSFIAAYDAVMTTGGGAAALRASGRADEMAIMGGEGSAPGIELMYEEAGVDACSGISFVPEAYGAMMGLVRIFAGEDPYVGETGIGSQVCDLQHNLPPKGEPFQAPIDYPAEYEKLWELR